MVTARGTLCTRASESSTLAQRIGTTRATRWAWPRQSTCRRKPYRQWANDTAANLGMSCSIGCQVWWTSRRPGASTRGRWGPSRSSCVWGCPCGSRTKPEWSMARAAVGPSWAWATSPSPARTTTRWSRSSGTSSHTSGKAFRSRPAFRCTKTPTGWTSSRGCWRGSPTSAFGPPMRSATHSSLLSDCLLIVSGSSVCLSVLADG
mmetsp:Transcript_37039/g.92887  ORF Transcript_37039/g.92887 Transcript_37039/m.92887 type:complete len:205 (+) Transcript_37039:668-1282(+)